jgi:hypothetical protein
VLPQKRSLLQIKVVERDDPVDLYCPAQVADGEQHVLEIPFVLLIGHVENIV